MGVSSSTKEKFNQLQEKANADVNKMIAQCLTEKNQKDIENLKNERNGDFNPSLNIRIYSNEKCPEKYKNYLESIKMKEWKIEYYDDGFSPKTTNELIDIYKKKSENIKNFDEVLIIIINSYESFIKAIKDDNKNFLKEFNENLFIEEQPFFLFLNKNSNDFKCSDSKEPQFKYNNYEKFKEECIKNILEKKEDNNVEIYYDIKLDVSIIDKIKAFLEKKESNKDNFNIILDKGKELIYNSQYIEQDDKDKILKSLANSHNLIIRNLDSNINIEENFECLKQISKINKVKFYFKFYETNFNKSFEEYLSQYKLLDKRNFKVQSYYYCPYLEFQKFCSYYHQYGDTLVKDKFAQYISKINVAVCGRAGAGKSTLLNVILGKKRCLEGQGQSISSFITSYSHPKYPINFVDFPGFGDKNNAENLIRHIKEKNSQLHKIKEEIHVVIYCIKFEERTFLDKEEDVIYELMKLKVKIIFVFTKGDKEDSPQFKRFKNTFLKDLVNILKKKNIEINTNEDIKIVPVYSMKEERNGYLIESFGIDRLFKVIYGNLREKKINEKILEKLKNMKKEDEEEIDKIIKSTELMKINQLRKELIKAIRDKVSVKISLFLGKLLLTGPKIYFIKMDDMILSLVNDANDLIYDLSCIYCKALDKEESYKLLNRTIEMIKSMFKGGLEATEDKDFKDGDLPWYLRIVGIVLTPISLFFGGCFLTIFSAKLKRLLCEIFEKEGNINMNVYLYQFACGLNKGIDGFRKLSKEFEESYKNSSK